jgi:hypothetical protein
MKLFIALPNTYFDVGTEADLVDRLDREYGLFFGLHGGKFDEAVCKFKEFKVKFISEKGERIAGGDYADEERD